MSHIAARMLRRLTQNTRGAVIVEFAFALPVLVLMYTGGVYLSDRVSASRKVTVATRSLVDLVSRTMSPTIIYNDPTSANAKSHLSASAVVLAPYKLDKAIQQVSLLRVCDATHAYVVWSQAQSQNVNGSVVKPEIPSHTAGTLPKSEAQSADNIVSIPNNMITDTMIPVSPDGSNVCGNFAPGTSNKTQVGTAGGWLFMGKITYDYMPFISYLPMTSTRMTETIYMVPRLY
ncbi:MULTISPECIES: TadE/TadG family type IV pilus assembly protein [unclassified Sphingopyxis]|uniref:TadE/TadG family type IV pilus assembly protein n=1 Tax=unclassified Sphingopyxis TaxID=2614943 RepID=UPI0012E35751|nr:MULTISPECIES: TadE/TadG family type IV pilus assembly protein [unclassified Sphingopyxis]